MKSTKTIPLVLEDNGGRVIRSFNWSQPKLHLVRKNRTGRVEALTNEEDFKNEESTLIKTISVGQLTSRKVQIPEVGSIRRLRDGEEIEFYSTPVETENDDDFAKTLKWTAYVHAAFLVLAFISFWTHKVFFEPEETVVKITPPKKIVQVEKKAKPTVAPSKKKINRKKKVVKKVAKTKPTRKRAKRKSVSRVGALGALGGVSTGAKGGSGLNLKSALKNTGSGDSLGRKSLGDATTSFAGKALSANSGGGGKTNIGGVGYGTKGRSGGQAGYGKLNIGGGSGGYEHPMQEDGTADGGLEMSQIEAVIKRNIGQIFYCYEKGLQAKPQLSGRVVSNFIIGGSGRVSMAQVGRSSLKSAAVESCITSKIKGWKFPRPHGNVDVNVSYPFILKRAR